MGSRLTCLTLLCLLDLLLSVLVPRGAEPQWDSVVQVANGREQSLGVKQEVQRGNFHLEQQNQV